MFSGITNKIPIPKIYVNSNQTLTDNTKINLHLRYGKKLLPNISMKPQMKSMKKYKNCNKKYSN